MAIKATCSSCSSTFNAKDTLAGRRVKCPKCGDRLTVPEKAAAAPKKKKRVNPAAGAYDIMDELLKEANVQSVAKGPTCDDCGAELSVGAVICVECGFNLETGARLDTDINDDDAINTSTETAADRMMRQAEQAIDETPTSADDQDFGDGAESLVIAGVAGAILFVLIVIALVLIFVMENLSDQVHSSLISFVAGCTIGVGCIAWITTVAFMAKKIHGVICLATCGLYCIVFGFMQGKTLLLPTIVLIFSFLIALASGFYWTNYVPAT